MQVRTLTFVLFTSPRSELSAPPLLTLAAVVMRNSESVERRLIFRDVLHTSFYKHGLASFSVYVTCIGHYKERCVAIDSCQHSCVPFGQFSTTMAVCRRNWPPLRLWTVLLWGCEFIIVVEPGFAANGAACVLIRNRKQAGDILTVALTRKHPRYKSGR